MHQKTRYKELKKAAERYRFFHSKNNNKVEVWAKLLRTYIEENQYGEDLSVYKFELQTDAKINYEAPFFENKNLEKYVPISYTFTAVLEHKRNAEAIFYNFDSNEGQYLRCLLQRPEDLDPEEKNYVEGFVTIGSRLKYDLQGNEILAQNSPAVLTLVEKNSISNDAKSSLENLNKTNNITNNILNDETPNTAEKLGESSGNPIKYTNVYVFKVGCANTVYIKHHNGEGILFDCGVHYDRNTYTIDYSTYSDSINRIKRLKPTAVIISHFHEDHINLLHEINTTNLKGIFYNDKSCCKNSDVNKFLAKYSNICFGLDKLTINQLNTLISSRFDGIKIFETSYSKPTNDAYGIIPDTHKDNTIINNNGLMLCVYSTSNPDSRMILPGDVSYYSWPKEAELELKNLTRLLVPHHGGEVYVDKSFNNFEINKSIYVSRDDNYVPITNVYKLPDQKIIHREFLEKGMKIDANDFKYTSRIPDTSDPYYQIRIPQ